MLNQKIENQKIIDFQNFMLLGRWRCVLSVFQLGSKSLSTATEHGHVILSY
jgi:hypothetical protein